jgi:ubiquinone/menaquinone biosynthesis C-methylase UbiE
MATETPYSHVLHHARLYDLGTTLLGGRLRALRQRLLDRAELAPGQRVLDVGCGPGRLTLAAAEAVGPTGEALGIDPSPEMIALATEKAERATSQAHFETASIEALPASDDHFDVVLASLMLHHLPLELQERGMAEVLRVLEPGGCFVVLDFRATPGHGLVHLLNVLGLRRGSQHAEHLRALAAAAGFTDIEVDAVDRAFCIVRARKPVITRH